LEDFNNSFESEDNRMPKAPLEEKSAFLQLLVLVSIILLASGVFYKLAFIGAQRFFGIQDALGFLSDATRWETGRSALIFVQMVISLGSFILPGVLFMYLISVTPFSYIKLGSVPAAKLILYTVLVMLTGGFVVDLLVKAMELIPFKDMDSAFIREMLRTQETAEVAYKTFLNFNTVPGFLLVFFLMAVMPAVGEELVFRGLIQNIFMKSYGNAHLAIGFTAFWFAIIHAQLTNLPALFFMGLILGYIYFWTGSLWVPVVAHLFNNGFIVILAGLHKIGIISYDVQGAESFPWYVSLAGSIIFIPLLMMYKKLAHKKISIS
jgi:uncharacterized protein